VKIQATAASNSERIRRLSGIFARDAWGKPPVFSASEEFQSDPHGRDHILFYHYFHGDNGAGLGASQRTSWTGLAARFVRAFHMDVLQTHESSNRLVPSQGETKQ
jgi:hypothetical protein